jgi:hypothetical protein
MVARMPVAKMERFTITLLWVSQSGSKPSADHPIESGDWLRGVDCGYYADFYRWPAVCEAWPVIRGET